MDLAPRRARSYVNALPSRDRVMLVRADGLATPVTGVRTRPHASWKTRLSPRSPAPTALNLDQALALCAAYLSPRAGRAGEIAFIGAGPRRENASRRPPRRQAICAPLMVADRCKIAACAESGCGAPAPTGTLAYLCVARNYGVAPRPSPFRRLRAARKAGRVPAGNTARLVLPAGTEGDQLRVPHPRRRLLGRARSYRTTAFPTTTAPNWNFRRSPGSR